MGVRFRLSNRYSRILNSQNAKRKEGQARTPCRPSTIADQEAQGGQGVQPALREDPQVLRNWRRHPAQARLDPLRQVAQVCPHPASTCRSPKAPQGAPNGQPVQPVPRQADCRRLLQVGAEVQARVACREESPSSPMTSTPSRSSSSSQPCAAAWESPTASSASRTARASLSPT